MSGARRSRRIDERSATREAGADAAGLVRPEFRPTLPTLLRGRRRLVWTVAAAVIAVALAGWAVTRAAGSADTPSTLVHREPDFSLLVREGTLRRVEPRAGEHVRLEGRGDDVTVSVVVAPLPRTSTGGDPTLAELPIAADRLLDERRQRRDSPVVLEEGRARVNGAPGYQVRHRSGPQDATRFGHDVLLVPEPPESGPGLMISLVQQNSTAALGPGDRRLAYDAKRAFRSLRFGTERP